MNNLQWYYLYSFVEGGLRNLDGMVLDVGSNFTLHHDIHFPDAFIDYDSEFMYLYP